MADPTPQATVPAPAPTAAPVAPTIATPPPSAPDLSGLTGPGPAVPTRADAIQTQIAPLQSEQGVLASQIKSLAQPAPTAPAPHARLLAMIEGLGAGLSAAGVSLSTHGKEGGAQMAAQIIGEEQRQKEEKVQAAQAAKNSQIQQLMTVYDTNQKQMQSIINLATLPNEMAESDLKVKGEQQELATGKLDYQDKHNDFISKWGYSPDAPSPAAPGVSGTAGGTASGVPGNVAFQSRYIDFAAGVLPGKEKNPAVVAARAALDEAQKSGSTDATIAATAGLRQAVALNTQATDIKTKEQAAAETAPIGDKADDTNAMTLRRYQASNPGAKTLPKEYAVTKDSTPADWNRIDKIMQQTENAQGTQATRNLANQIRQETLNYLKGPQGIDANATGQEYLKQVQAADPGEANMLKGYGSGTLEFPATAARTEQGQALLTKILRAYPDFDPSVAPAYYATRKDFTSGKTSVGINSYNTAINHLGRMYDHIAGASNTDLNNPTSDVNRQLQTDKTAVSTELAKAVANGSLTEGEKDSWEAAISGKTFGVATKDKYNTQIKEVVGLMNGKLDAYQQQWKNGKKAASGQWETTPMPSGAQAPIIVSDDAQAIISKIGGAPQTSTVPPGATGIAPDRATGKMYYHDAAGNVLGPAPNQP